MGVKIQNLLGKIEEIGLGVGAKGGLGGESEC